jgi:hypothetical protein
MAGVIDQDIDGAEALLRGAHDVLHPGVVSDIERERERGIRVRPGEILDRGRVTSRHNDALAAAAVPSFALVRVGSAPSCRL